MNPVVLTSKTSNNVPLKAVFLPDKGMTLASYCKGDVEVIDQATRGEFDARGAGLGCLIGPHFHEQKEQWIVPVKDESLFPHIAVARKTGHKDLFSHGIGRYAPWNYTVSGNAIRAHLSGSDKWKGIPLAELEGVDFQMHFEAELTPKGLNLAMRVSSNRVCLIGTHYYYTLPKGKATVTSQVQDQYNDMGQFKPMLSKWTSGGNHSLLFDLAEAADYGFLPLSECRGVVELQTATHSLRISYQGENDEVSWQLYHPKGASFVCIEPTSAKNPRNLTATSSLLKVQIEIVA